MSTTAVDGPPPQAPPSRSGALLVPAMAAGLLIGPAVAAGAAIGGVIAPVAATLLMAAMTAVGVIGLVVTTRRWRAAKRDARPVARGPATRFATVGQRASFGLAIALLAVAALIVPTSLVASATGPQEGPGKDVLAILLLALGLVVVSALVVPVVAAQVAWTWRREVPAAEAAVLAGTVPGPRRRIVRARTVAVIAWVLATALAAVFTVMLAGESVTRVTASASAYSARAAAAELRDVLTDDYVVGDIRCPASLPVPVFRSSFTCVVTSLGRPHTLHVDWLPSGYGPGDVQAVRPSTAGLVRVQDLQGPVPTSVAVTRDVPAAEVERSVRAQLVDEGWSTGSRAVRALRCPGLGSGYGGGVDGFVRCTVGADPRTQRSLDVYPTGSDGFTARTAEITDLPR